MAGPRENTHATTDDTERPPIYVQGATRDEVWAHFTSGIVVRAGRSRRRSYPGLHGEAPPTLPFYAALVQVAEGRRHILDLGAGSGEGARKLTDHFGRVIAVDRDSRAIAFCREYAPKVETLQVDLENSVGLPDADAAIAVDLLGHLRSPERALLSARDALAEDAPLLLAEPTAHASQSLRHPLRRAFSQRDLTSLLLRTGYLVQGWICDRGSFLSVLARASDEEAVGELRLGTTLELDGRSSEALVAYERATLSQRPAVRAEALLASAQVRLSIGDGDGAARAYMAARDAAPEDGRALGGLAQLALATGEHRDALALALEAIRLEPTDPSAATALSMAAERLEHRDAYRLWRVTARLAPDDPAVMTQLARVAAGHGDYDYCISLFERLREYGDAVGPNFHVTLAWLLVAAGRPADAALEARIATTLAPSDPAVAELWLALEQTGSPIGRG